MNKYLEIIRIGSKLCNLRDCEVFSLFFSRVNFQFTEDVPIAGIQYRDKTFCISFSDNYFKFNDEAKMAILGHELIHYMYKHPLVYADRLGDDLLQICMDMFINQILEIILPGALPKGSVDINDFIEAKLLTESDRNKDVMHYYRRLKREEDKINQKVKHYWESFKDMPITEKEIHDLRVDTIREGIGNESGTFRDLKVNKRKVPIDYKKIISRFLNNCFFTEQDYSHSFLNKRYKDFPGSYEKDIPSLLMAVDTSGSMNDRDVNEIFDQIDKVYQLGCKIDIIEADASVGNTYEYKGKRPSKLSGGGGTIFDPAIEYYNKNNNKYGAMIYLTDGHAYTPSVRPLKELLWILTSTTSKTVEDLKQEKFKGLFLKLEYE